MIDFHTEMVNALETVLPAYYELALTANTKTPCISYQERNNYDTDTGDTIGYSKIAYTIKIWANDLKTIQSNVLKVDKALRNIGFKRTSANELYDINSTMIQKILTYEALAKEEY